MLHQAMAGKPITEWIVSAQHFKPFPSVLDRDSWMRLPEHVKKHWIAQGEAGLNDNWPSLPAIRYLDYKRTGNRTEFQKPYHERRKMLVKLAIAECIEDQGRFLDAIVNAIWAICEESYWVLPAHLYLSQKAAGDGLPDVDDQTIDLMAAETAVVLAGVHYLLLPRLDGVSKNVCKRIRQELDRRIFNPYLARNDFWWMGFESRKPVNNWNPWINSGCLFAFLLLEDNSARRAEGIGKVIRSLGRFLDSYAADGGCDEGPAYWDRAGGSLFDCLEMLYVGTGGKVNLFQNPLIREIGLYICRTHIDGNDFINFADSSARLSIDAGVLYRFGRRIENPLLTGLGVAQLPYMKEGDSLSLHRVVPLLFLRDEMESAEPKVPYLRDVWMEDIQVMAARELQGSAEGLFLGAKGGHNEESHNHNDVGQFIVYCDGLPVLIDVGVETYSAKTFGPDRYSIWTMRSAYHNLPAVNGVEQEDGRGYLADNVVYHSDDGSAELSLNLEKAYPQAAGILFWRRACKLFRGHSPYIEITDSFQLEKLSSDIHLHFMTPYLPVIEGGDVLLRLPNGGTIRLSSSIDNAQVEFQPISLEDERLRNVWGTTLYRITMTSKNSIKRAEWALLVRRK